MQYDKNNIFAKILRGEIPCKKIYENEYVLAFHDANPQKKIQNFGVSRIIYTDINRDGTKHQLLRELYYHSYQ